MLQAGGAALSCLGQGSLGDSGLAQAARSGAVLCLLLYRAAWWSLHTAQLAVIRELCLFTTCSCFTLLQPEPLRKWFALATGAALKLVSNPCRDVNGVGTILLWSSSFCMYFIYSFFLKTRGRKRGLEELINLHCVVTASSLPGWKLHGYHTGQCWTVTPRKAAFTTVKTLNSVAAYVSS